MDVFDVAECLSLRKNWYVKSKTSVRTTNKSWLKSSNIHHGLKQTGSE